MILLTILIFIIVIGLLVFVHELGHFVMAKRAGMRVDEFGFGFPPRIFGYKRGDTTYSINWIPLGGFVKILGEDGESHDQDSFAAKSALKRFSVLIAGVTMNALFAYLLITIGLMIGLPTLLGEGESLSAGARASAPQVTVLYVDEGSPAQGAGLRAGDVIEGIDGLHFETIEAVQDFTSVQAGRMLSYSITRGDEFLEAGIIPRVNPPEGEGPIGVSLGLVARVSYPWYRALYLGLQSTFSLGVQIVLAFGALIKSLLTDRSLVGSLTGPVGIAVLTRDAARLGFSNLLYFTSVLSVNLAIINALPFPALDGGRILFLIVEKIRNRKINLKVESFANTSGFFLLILLMVWVTVKDVNRFSSQLSSLWDRIIGIF